MGAIANRVAMVNPAAGLFDLTIGGLYSLFLSDPKAILAVDPTIIVPAAEIATGMNGVAAGAAGIAEGWGHIAHAFSESVGALFSAADVGFTGGALTMTFAAVAAVGITNHLVSNNEPA